VKFHGIADRMEAAFLCGERRDGASPCLTAALWSLFLCLGGLTLWSLLQGPGYADESYFHWLAKEGKVLPGSAAPWYFSWCAKESLLLLRCVCALLELLADGILALGVGIWLGRTGKGHFRQVLTLFPAVVAGRMLCNWTSPPYADYVTLNQVAASAALGCFFAGSVFRGIGRSICFALAGIIGVQFVFFAPPGLILILPVCWYFLGRGKGEVAAFLLGCLAGTAGYFLLVESPGAYWARLLADVAYYRTPCPTEHHNFRETLLWCFWALSGAVRCILLPGCLLALWLWNKGRELPDRVVRWSVPLLFLLNFLPEFHAGLSRSWSGGLPVALLCAFALGFWLDDAKHKAPDRRETVLFWTLLWMPLFLSFGSDMSFLHRCRCYSSFALLAAVLAALLSGRKWVPGALAVLLLAGGVLAACQFRVPLWSRNPEKNVSLRDETVRWRADGADRWLRCTPAQAEDAATLEKLSRGRTMLCGGKYLWHWRFRLHLGTPTLLCYSTMEAQVASLKKAGVKPEALLLVESRAGRLMTPAVERLFRQELGVKEISRHPLAGPYDALTFR